MMLAELMLLLGIVPPDAAHSEYRNAIVEDNALLKSTGTTRQRSLRYLRELYALDPNVLLFRALRDLWDDDAVAQPMLALLSSVARDPLLRGTAEPVLSEPPGATVTPQVLADAVEQSFPGRYNAEIRAKIGRNTASSWTQSGHLQGRTSKRRARPTARPASVAYALLLGHLCDVRGDALFTTLWCRLLDEPPHVLREQAAVAAHRGWIEYRAAGNVTEVGFRHLLRSAKETV